MSTNQEAEELKKTWAIPLSFSSVVEEEDNSSAFLYTILGLMGNKGVLLAVRW